MTRLSFLSAATLCAALFALTAAPARAAEVLAEYWANSGSLPPEYAWDVTVTIHTDGQVILTHCKGYATEPPGCKTRKGKADAAKLDAIRAAVVEADLIANPARTSDEVIVGGGASAGRVTLDGQKISLPSQPVVEDANRVGMVLRTVYDAIPTRLAKKFIEGN
jgi:hypothetical protein